MGRRCFRLSILLVVLIPLLKTVSASGQVISSGTISAQQVGANSYTYSLSLSVDPSSDENAYSYWFAWIPGYDFLPSNPTSFTSPAGWTDVNKPDTIGVASMLWSTNTNSIAPGETLTGFTFTTPDPPSVIYGIYAPLDIPVTTSYVYEYPQARGDDDVIVPAIVSVPEPAAMPIVLIIVAMLLVRRSRPQRLVA